MFRQNETMGSETKCERNGDGTLEASKQSSKISILMLHYYANPTKNKRHNVNDRRRATRAPGRLDPCPSQQKNERVLLQCLLFKKCFSLTWKRREVKNFPGLCPRLLLFLSLP